MNVTRTAVAVVKVYIPFLIKGIFTIKAKKGIERGRHVKRTVNLVFRKK